MEFKIGNNIKKYRVKHNMTQEQLAEYLNVSHQAVSKWEAGSTMPDVYMLPELAKFFDVSIDELFGYNNIAEKKAIDNIISLVDEACNNTRLDQAEEYCKDGLKKYPRSDKLKCKMAVILKTKYLISDNKNVSWLEDAISLCEDVIETSRDERLIHISTKTKAISYAYLGDKISALRTAENIVRDYDNLLVYISDGYEKIDACQKDIEEHLTVVRKMLKLMAKVYKNKGDNQMYDKYINATVDISFRNS